MRRPTKEEGLWLVPLIIVILLWEIIAGYVIKDALILPRFSAVIFSIYMLRELLILDILVSILHFGIGMTLAFSVALPLAIAMGWFRNVFRAVDPIIEIVRPIPPLAWIPLAIVWIGLNHYAAGFIIFIGAFFPILINSYTGFRDVPRVLVETGNVLGCIGNIKLIRYVALPYALPSIATGTRVGMGVGWMCVVAAEMFGVGNSGLGYRLFQKFYFLHQMDYVVAYMLILGVLALCLDRLFRHLVEDKLFRWKKGIVK
ncbi:MAG TPA: ABC transporter permease [Candidatus Bathyarchaeia archaeon]|nr:ABC transporter permease [Candidatus Bathyarchaeia archaeon]